MDKDRARALLERERERLQALRDSDEVAEARQTDRESSSEITNFDQHHADHASDLFEREKELSIAEHAEHGLAEVEAAFTRLEAGTYGTCEVGGEPIADERLEAVPAARRCAEHQAEADRRAS